MNPASHEWPLTQVHCPPALTPREYCSRRAGVLGPTSAVSQGGQSPSPARAGYQGVSLRGVAALSFVHHGAIAGDVAVVEIERVVGAARVLSSEHFQLAKAPVLLRAIVARHVHDLVHEVEQKPSCDAEHAAAQASARVPSRHDHLHRTDPGRGRIPQSEPGSPRGRHPPARAVIKPAAFQMSVKASADSPPPQTRLRATANPTLSTTSTGARVRRDRARPSSRLVAMQATFQTR